MKKYLFFLFLLIGINFISAQDLKPVARIVENVKTQKKNFKNVQGLIKVVNTNLRLDEIKDNSKVTFFNYNKGIFNNELINKSSKFISLKILLDNKNYDLKLVEVSDAFNEYSVKTSSGGKITSNSKAKHYRGVVNGMENESLVSISFFEKELMGVISIDGVGNINLGKLKNSNIHIIYADNNVSNIPNYGCDTPDEGLEGLPYRSEQLFKSNNNKSENSCVKIYFETEYDIFVSLGSVNAVENYVVGLFNQIATLYQNESINLEISEIKVWNTVDPYNATNTADLLMEFQNEINTFNGDLGQLLTFRSAGGGRAAGFNGLCNSNPDLRLSVSASLESTFPNVPTYSWSAMVTTHELGHLFGSRHTHACVWNGNSTQIDDCGNEFFFNLGYPVSQLEGSACFNSNNPIIPSGGGTIMSYCHLFSVGINFNLGFGTQPGNLIRSNVANASCLDACCEGSVIFHFEHENGTEDTVFNICEDVYLDGSATLNTGSYFMDIWRVNSNNTLSWLSAKGVNGWTNGQPDLVNVTQTFKNDVENPVTFQAGVTYEVKLAINHPSCGWTSVVHRFTYVDVGISSFFDIDEYNCHDGVYDVTVTAQDTFPSQWWKVYETSVEGQTGDSVTIGSVSSTHGGTTTTFTNLDPDKFYYIKHGVWTANCSWQETRTPLDRDCCIDNPQIEPYWEYCSSKFLCDLDTWPIRVVDENENPITGSDGVQFSWVSSDGGSSISDVVYTVAFEEWTLTLTYPDGCIYTRTYKKLCCEEDIHIEIDECPTREEIAALEQQVQIGKSQLSDEAYIKYINAIKNYKERVINAKVECDPCDNGTVVMRVVDSNGNLVTNFISITWGDGLFPNSNVRLGDVNVTYTVTVVVPANEGKDICTYTDTYIYECPCDLPVPTNVHLHGTSFLHWNAVPGAVGYIVSNSNVWNIGCNCRYPSSMRPIETTNNYTNLPLADGRCYMLRVAAICADGSISEYSEDICVGGGGKGSFGKKDITCTTSFVKKQIREVSITPNPTKGEMTFNVTTNMDTEVTIAVYDTYGTLIKTFVQQVTSDDTNSISWDGSNLRKGIYFVNFKTKEETIYKQVIVK